MMVNKNDLRKKQTDKISEPDKKKRKVHHRVIEKKPYIEFITAFISIPLSLTWLLLNFNNLRNINVAKPTPTPTPVVIYKEVQTQDGKTPAAAIQPSTMVKVVEKDACVKKLGPISIDSPAEGETVHDNPATFTIKYDDTTYCGAVWSYRVNGGQWSDYDNKSLGIYNLPNGSVTLELHVKSMATNDEKTLVRHITYTGNTQNTASSSAQ